MPALAHDLHRKRVHVSTFLVSELAMQCCDYPNAVRLMQEARPYLTMQLLTLTALINPSSKSPAALLQRDPVHAGSSQDSIDYWAAKVRELEHAIREQSQEALKGPAATSFFVFLHQSAGCRDRSPSQPAPSGRQCVPGHGGPRS